MKIHLIDMKFHIKKILYNNKPFIFTLVGDK